MLLDPFVEVYFLLQRLEINSFIENVFVDEERNLARISRPCAATTTTMEPSRTINSLKHETSVKIFSSMSDWEMIPPPL